MFGCSMYSGLQTNQVTHKLLGVWLDKISFMFNLLSYKLVKFKLNFSALCKSVETELTSSRLVKVRKLAQLRAQIQTRLGVYFHTF